jgi:hypothetical protein
MCKSFFWRKKSKKEKRISRKEGRSMERHCKGITKTAAFGERRR